MIPFSVILGLHGYSMTPEEETWCVRLYFILGIFLTLVLG